MSKLTDKIIRLAKKERDRSTFWSLARNAKDDAFRVGGNFEEVLQCIEANGKY